MVGPLLHGTGKLAYRDKRDLKLPRQCLERARYFRYLLLPGIGPRRAFHKLQVVEYDEFYIKL